MLEITNRPRRSEWVGGDLPNPVRAFLIESEQRVLWHCHKLLQNPELPSEERQRLVGLSEQAEAELRQLEG